jgi:hypothetical protein
VSAWDYGVPFLFVIARGLHAKSSTHPPRRQWEWESAGKQKKKRLAPPEFHKNCKSEAHQQHNFFIGRLREISDVAVFALPYPTASNSNRMDSGFQEALFPFVIHSLQ